MKPVNPNSTNSWRTHAGFAPLLAQKELRAAFRQRWQHVAAWSVLCRVGMALSGILTNCQ